MNGAYVAIGVLAVWILYKGNIFGTATAALGTSGTTLATQQAKTTQAQVGLLNSIVTGLFGQKATPPQSSGGGGKSSGGGSGMGSNPTSASTTKGSTSQQAGQGTTPSDLVSSPEAQQLQAQGWTTSDIASTLSATGLSAADLLNLSEQGWTQDQIMSLVGDANPPTDFSASTDPNGGGIVGSGNESAGLNTGTPPSDIVASVLQDPGLGYDPSAGMDGGGGDYASGF